MENSQGWREHLLFGKSQKVSRRTTANCGVARKWTNYVLGYEKNSSVRPTAKIKNMHEFYCGINVTLFFSSVLKRLSPRNIFFLHSSSCLGCVHSVLMGWDFLLPVGFGHISQVQFQIVSRPLDNIMWCYSSLKCFKSNNPFVWSSPAVTDI